MIGKYSDTFREMVPTDISKTLLKMSQLRQDYIWEEGQISDVSTIETLVHLASTGAAISNTFVIYVLLIWKGLNIYIYTILSLWFGPNLLLCFSSNNPLKQWPAQRDSIFLSFGTRQTKKNLYFLNVSDNNLLRSFGLIR